MWVTAFLGNPWPIGLCNAHLSGFLGFFSHAAIPI